MTTPAIRAENLAKTYTGEGAPVTVFSGLSFEVPEGVLAAAVLPARAAARLAPGEAIRLSR